MAALKKAEFMRRCCEKCTMNLTREQMRSAHDSIMEVIREALLEQEDIVFPGIGTIYMYVKESYLSRNPMTQEQVTVPDRVKARFKFNNNLKAALRNIDLEPKKKGSRRN